MNATTPVCFLPVLSNSEAKDFRACARSHHYRYNLLRRPIGGDEATRFGSLWHLGLEAWHLAIQAGAPQDDWLAVAIDAVRTSANPDPLDLAKVEELLRGYHLRWCAEGYEVISVEAEFRCALVNPATRAPSKTYQLGGKLDVLIRDASGRVLIEEHKTSSEDIGVGSEYWRRLTLDPQISTYFVGARALGYEPEGCLYDVVGKPRMKLSAVPLVDEDGRKIVLDPAGERVRTKDGKKWRETGDSASGYTLQTREETLDEYRARLREDIATDPDRYYQRGEVTRLAEQEEEAAFDMWATARLIREAELANRHPRNPDACSRYGRTCAYFSVCCGEASLDDPTLFRQAERAHEELSQEASDAA